MGTKSAGAAPPAEALLELHRSEAAAYQMSLDPDDQQPLALQPAPIFAWTNVELNDPQDGHLFAWTRNGRPEVIGTIFSRRDFDNPSRRVVVHEFASLASDPLSIKTPEFSRTQWEPQAGLQLVALPQAPAVASAAGGRLLQLKTLARQFTARTISREKQTDELRLLPRPLLRYQPAVGPVVDGAILAMVGAAGTDPELLLVLEARASALQSASEKSLRQDDPRLQWTAAALRFSDRDLVVEYDGKTLWTSVADESRRVVANSDWTHMQVPDQTYVCYLAHVIDELPDATEALPR